MRVKKHKINDKADCFSYDRNKSIVKVMSYSLLKDKNVISGVCLLNGLILAEMYTV